MSRRVLRILVEVEGEAFDPDATNPYADTQVELDAVLNSNLQTITSMDAGDVVTLRDTNGNRCGKVECEDFPGDSPLLPYWTKLSDLAQDVEEEFPVAAFVKSAMPKEVPVSERILGSKSDKLSHPPRKSDETFDEEAARAFDEGELTYPGEPSSHEHIAVDPDRAEGPPRPRKARPPQSGAPVGSVPPPPGDPRMKK